MKYDPSNLFAKILRGELACKRVYEDEFALAFEDIAPAAPVHVLVVPKGEYRSFHDFAQSASPEFMKGYLNAVQQVAEQLGLEKDGYRLIANHGVIASQTVQHFHMHILAGRKLGSLLP